MQGSRSTRWYPYSTSSPRCNCLSGALLLYHTTALDSEARAHSRSLRKQTYSVRTVLARVMRQKWLWFINRVLSQTAGRYVPKTAFFFSPSLLQSVFAARRFRLTSTSSRNFLNHRDNLPKADNGRGRRRGLWTPRCKWTEASPDPRYRRSVRR